MMTVIGTHNISQRQTHAAIRDPGVSSGLVARLGMLRGGDAAVVLKAFGSGLHCWGGPQYILSLFFLAEIAMWLILNGDD